MSICTIGEACVDPECIVMSVLLVPFSDERPRWFCLTNVRNESRDETDFELILRASLDERDSVVEGGVSETFAV